MPQGLEDQEGDLSSEESEMTGASSDSSEEDDDSSDPNYNPCLDH